MEGKRKAQLIRGGNESVRFYHNVFPEWHPFICERRLKGCTCAVKVARLSRANGLNCREQTRELFSFVMGEPLSYSFNCTNAVLRMLVSCRAFLEPEGRVIFPSAGVNIKGPLLTPGYVSSLCR